MQDSHNNIDREKLLKQKVIFCTECGAELQNFCFNLGPNDSEAIRKNLAQCKKSGRFAGEFCSKLFICDDNNLDLLFDNDKI